MAQTELVCEQDGESTRLTCVQCKKAICPKCLIRTPVGMKCLTCGTGGVRARRSRGTLVLGAVVAAIVLAALIVPRLLSGSSDDVGVDAAPRVPDPEVPARFARIGMEARDGDLAFTVTTFECGPTQLEGGSPPRVALGKFCLMAIDIRNNGRSPVNFIARAQMLQDAQTRSFGPDMAATTAHPGNAGRDLGTVVINPGNALQGVIVFDVPPDAEPAFATFRAAAQGRGAFVSLTPPP